MEFPYVDETMDAAGLIAQMRLTRDLQASAKKLDRIQARYLVDFYYTMQDLRIRAAGQIRSMAAADEPNDLLQWTVKMYAQLEDDTKHALKVYAESKEPGRWALSIHGIGPVIAAGLLAHINVERTLTAGQLWSFAGYNPTVVWRKGEKRPWNVKLKTLGWKASTSFIKFQNNPECYYGKIYRQRKAYELGKNNMNAVMVAGKTAYTVLDPSRTSDYADQAARALTLKNYGEETDARKWYEQGMLSPGHIQARVTRYTAKMFLSHYHKVAFESFYGKKAPTPWVIQFGGHVHEIFPPGWESPMQ